MNMNMSNIRPSLMTAANAAYSPIDLANAGELPDHLWRPRLWHFLGALMLRILSGTN
jgi:hypothetical protein